MSVLDFNDAGPQQTAGARAPSLDRYSAADEFRRAVVDFGLLPGEVTASSGKIVRCQVAGDKSNQKSGWFVYYDDDLPAGAFGNWRNGDVGNWCVKAEVAMNPAEALAYRHKMDKAREAREAERARLASEAAKGALEQWDKAAVADKHPYLEAKGVSSFGLKLLGGKLLVPMQDMDGRVCGLQSIDAAGEKRFSFGCEKKGRFFLLPGENKTAICEGYATAASVHMATGWTVLVAFDAGNLKPVAEAWRKHCPQDEIIICGDDDAFTPNNPGKKAASEAAEAVSAAVLLPDFAGCERGRATDWNDLHALAGLDAVKRQLGKERDYRVRIEDWGLERFRGSAPERQWLIERTMPMASVFVLAAMGDAGKGLLTLDLALKVAGKIPATPEWAGENFNEPVCAFGNKVMQRGPVVIFSAEDDKDELHRRLENIGPGAAENIFLVPLPNAGGPMPIVAPGKHGPEATAFWHETREQLVRLKPALINFDPLSSFVMADINADPAVGAFTMGLLAQLAQETGAAVLVAHHLGKDSGAVSTPEQARRLVRGTTAIVDNSRAVYVLWATEEQIGRGICKDLALSWERGKIFSGCLVKSNGPGDREIKTYVRNDIGLLEVCSDALRTAVRDSMPAMLEAFERVIAEAAKRGQPFCERGDNGFEARRHELPEHIREYGRRSITKVINELLEAKRVFKCVAKGQKTKKYLDVPGGPFALGMGEIVTGASDDV